MATFTVRPEGIIRQPALTMPGNATGAEAACTSLTASQIRTLLSLGTTSDVTFDIVRATTSVQTPLVNNASAALTLGNATYGVTVPGAATFSGNNLVTNANVNSCEYRATNSSSGVSGYFGAGGTTGFSSSRYANAAYLESSGGPLHLSSYAGRLAFFTNQIERMSISVAGDTVTTGDISMQKTSAQGYIRAYATDGVKNIAFYHNASSGYINSSVGNANITSATGVVNAFSPGIAGRINVYAANQTDALSLFSDGNISVSTGDINLLGGTSRIRTYNGTDVWLSPSSGGASIYNGTATPCNLRVWGDAASKWTKVEHDGTNGILSTSSGNLNLVPTGGTVAVTGGITASGVVSHGAYTVATLPSAASNAGKMAQVTDSSVAASGNYGATVAAGGANRVKVFSDGTNWVIA